MAKKPRRGGRAGPAGSRVRPAATGRAQRVKTGGHRWSDEAEELFFDHLAACGNVRASSEAVGFSASTVYALRRSRPNFADKWAAAIGTRGAQPPLRRIEDAPESIVRGWRDGRAKRIRCLTQWSEEVEELFLDLLAATCNVTLAAEEAGVGHTSVYRQRRLRADFAAKWQAALEQGYARLEIGLVEAANDAIGHVVFDADRPAPKMSVEQAMKVLAMHRAIVKGVGRVSGWKAPPRGVEHYRESILRKVAAIRAARSHRGEGRNNPDDGA